MTLESRKRSHLSSYSLMEYKKRGNSMIYCIKCRCPMLIVMFVTHKDYILGKGTGFMCHKCGNVYDIRQIGPINTELRRDQNKYDV